MPQTRPSPTGNPAARPGPWRQVLAFLAWLGRPERLGPRPPSPPPAAPGQPGGFLRWLAAREHLPEPPAARTDGDDEPVLRWLFAADPPPSPPLSRGDDP